MANTEEQSVKNDTNSKPTSSPPDGDETKSLNEFAKIIKDLLNDLLTTFPELSEKLNEDLSNVYSNKGDQTASLTNLYNYCKCIYPERFFDILYQNETMYIDCEEGKDSSNEIKNTCFLPGIDFKNLWKEDISDATKKVLWKYKQLILFSIITNINDGDCFGNTAKLFEAIGETEFKDKLQDTMKQMEGIFDISNMQQGMGMGMGPGMAQAAGLDPSGINLEGLPQPKEIHDHINKIMEGKLGKLAQEIAEETAAGLDIDGTNVKSVGDIFQKLFKDPSKLMGIVKNVGSKLDEKMKSGDIKESELLEEATAMMGNMKNMPGMDNIGDLLSKLNLPNMGGMKGGKFNNNAFESAMSQNMKSAKTKERMKAKLDENNKAREQKAANAAKQPASAPNPSELEALNANLSELMKNMQQNMPADKDGAPNMNMPAGMPDLTELLNTIKANLPTPQNLDETVSNFNTPRKKKNRRGGKK